MEKTAENIKKAYITGIDWSCYYTKGVITPTIQEINKFYDFTWTQILILDLLEREKKLSMSQAARMLALPPQNLTKTIDSLVDASLVSRRHDELNQRTIYIRLTPSGISIARHCRRIRNDYFTRQMERIFTEEQQAEFLSAMQELDKLLHKLA